MPPALARGGGWRRFCRLRERRLNTRHRSSVGEPQSKWDRRRTSLPRQARVAIDSKRVIAPRRKPRLEASLGSRRNFPAGRSVLLEKTSGAEEVRTPDLCIANAVAERPDPLVYRVFYQFEFQACHRTASIWLHFVHHFVHGLAIGIYWTLLVEASQSQR